MALFPTGNWTLNQEITFKGRTYIWNGTGWQQQAASSGGGGGISYAASATAPSSPTLGDFWYNTTTAILFIYSEDSQNTKTWLSVA